MCVCVCAFFKIQEKNESEKKTEREKDKLWLLSMPIQAPTSLSLVYGKCSFVLSSLPFVSFHPCVRISTNLYCAKKQQNKNQISDAKVFPLPFIVFSLSFLLLHPHTIYIRM